MSNYIKVEKDLDIPTDKKIKTQWSQLIVGYWTDCKCQHHQHQGCWLFILYWFLYMGMLESEQAHGQILALIVGSNWKFIQGNKELTGAT